LVFQIGFSKCGTTTISQIFTDLGLRTAHHLDGALAREMGRQEAAGLALVDGFPSFDAFTDMVHLSDTVHIEGYKMYPRLLDQYQDSKFVLNTRHVDAWLSSCRRHPGLFERLMNVYTIATVWQLEAYLRDDWARHHDDVQRIVPANRLFVFDIDEPDLPGLETFLGFEAATDTPLSMPHSNRTMRPAGHRLANLTPLSIRSRIPPGTRDRVRRFLRSRG